MTLEEAKQAAVDFALDLVNSGLDSDEIIRVQSAEDMVKYVFKYLESKGFVLINKTLTPEQRTAATDAFWRERQQIQHMFDAILEKRPK